MSAKGSSPDNAACEGFFGRLKNEFFYYRDWKNISPETFMAELDAYLTYYDEGRIKRRGSPVACLNLSPSPHLLLFEIKAGSHPTAFRSANTALRSKFSIWSGLRPASGPDFGGS